MAYLAAHAWGDLRQSAWPDLIPDDRRNQYTLREIKHWLEGFLERFFHTSQFKRSAMPNAPKVGSGGSLSPRGDWRAPSDGTARTWLAELREQVPDHVCGLLVRASACCGQNRAGAGRGAEAQVRERDDLYSSATPVLRGTVRRASERLLGHLPVWRLYVAQSRR